MRWPHLLGLLVPCTTFSVHKSRWFAQLGLHSDCIWQLVMAPQPVYETDHCTAPGPCSIRYHLLDGPGRSLPLLLQDVATCMQGLAWYLHMAVSSANRSSATVYWTAQGACPVPAFARCGSIQAMSTLSWQQSVRFLFYVLLLFSHTALVPAV